MLAFICTSAAVTTALSSRAGIEAATARLRAYRQALEEEKAGRGASYDDAAVLILRDVYTKLRKAGASVPKPWIAACIARYDRGEGCPADIARLAVSKTLDDMQGGRYDITCLCEALARL